MTNPLRPKTIPLGPNEQVFHKYTVETVDVAKSGTSSTFNSMLVKDVADKVPFPAGSTPENNSNLRITPKLVSGTRAQKPLVEDVFFVVNMYNAKTDQEKNANKIDLANYTEMTSGSKKNGARDNRKWVRFGDLKRYERDSTTALKDQTAKVYSASAIPADVERAFSVGFTHESINLGSLSSVIRGMSKYPDFQTAVSHYSGQIVEKQLRTANITPSIVLGNRVFYDEGPSSHGLQQMVGYHGKITYDGESKPNILREPCTAHFFQNITVAQFMEQFFGPNVGATTDKSTLERMSAVLKGVHVIVATPKGEPNKTRQIIRVGSSTERDAVWVRAVGEPASALQSPKMPLVNIGSIENPIFHPSELCKIVGTDQIFKGQVPLIVSDEHFEPTSNESDDHRPLNGDPYPKYQSNDFTIFFINLAADVGGKPAKAVNYDVMTSFKTHIGKRYNSSLESSLSGLETLELTIDSFESDVAAHLTPGIKSVVVLVVPYSFPTNEIDRIRKTFDTRLGVQCQIVNARDINRRFHPVHDIGMKKITGGMVQQVFARAKIIKGDQIPSFVATSMTSHQILGINIRELDQSGNYLIDVVLVTDQGAQEIRVASRVFHASSEEMFAAQLFSCFKDNVRGSSESISIYIRGTSDEYARNVLKTFSSKMHRWFMAQKSDFRDRFMNLAWVTPGPNILMSNKNEMILLDRNRSNSIEQMTLAEISNHEQTTDAITAKVFNVLPHYDTVRSTHSPLQVNHLGFTTSTLNDSSSDKAINASISCAVVLSTHNVPSILYLAAESSKRSYLRVFTKDAAKLKSEQDQLVEDEKAHKQQVEDTKKHFSDSEKARQLAVEKTGDVEVDKLICQTVKVDCELEAGHALTALADDAPLPVCELDIKPLHYQLKNTFYFL